MKDYLFAEILLFKMLIDILLTSDPYNKSLVQELCDAITYRSPD